MIAWFKRLLAWQQIVLVMAAGMVAIAVVDRSDPVSPFGDRAGTGGSVPGTETEGRGFGGTYLGSFVVLHVIRPAEEPWDPWATFVLYVDEQGRARAEGWVAERFEASWGTARLDHAFSCEGAVDAFGNLTCVGTGRVAWTWDADGSVSPMAISLWRPAYTFRNQEESFDDIPVVLTATIEPHADGDATLTGFAEPAWDMTGDNAGLGVIGGNWYGPPGTPSPVVPPD